jgi:hypothetical protein
MGARPRKPVTTPETREQRISVRVTVDTYIRAAVVHTASGRKAHGWVLNLSPGGLFVSCRDQFDREEAVLVDALARLDGEVVHLRANGWVAYVSDEGMGIQFGHLSPEMAQRLAELIAKYG